MLMDFVDMGHGLELESDMAWRVMVLIEYVERETGITLRITRPDGAKRTWDRQYRLWVKDPSKAWHPDNPRANHMKGLSADIDNWMTVPSDVFDAGLRRAGLYRPFAHEPWHVEPTGPAPAGFDAIIFEPEPTPTLKGWLDMLTDTEQKELFENTRSIKRALLDGRPQSGMATGAVDLILENTTGALARIRGPLPWDMFQEIIRQFEALSASASPDFQAVVRDSEERLRATFESQFVEFGAAVRASILDAVEDATIEGGASKADVATAIDAALARLRLIVAPAL